MNYVLIIDGKLSNEWESYVFEGQSPISCIPSSNSLLTKSTSWFNPSTLFELLVYSGWCDLNSSMRNSSSQLESPLELLPCDTCLSNVAVCVFSYRWISTWHFSWCPRQPGAAAVNPRWGGRGAGEKKSKIEMYLSFRPLRSSPAPLHCISHGHWLPTLTQSERFSQHERNAGIGQNWPVLLSSRVLEPVPPEH